MGRKQGNFGPDRGRSADLARAGIAAVLGARDAAGDGADDPAAILAGGLIATGLAEERDRVSDGPDTDAPRVLDVLTAISSALRVSADTLRLSGIDPAHHERAIEGLNGIIAATEIASGQTALLRPPRTAGPAKPLPVFDLEDVEQVALLLADGGAATVTAVSGFIESRLPSLPAYARFPYLTGSLATAARSFVAAQISGATPEYRGHVFERSAHAAIAQLAGGLIEYGQTRGYDAFTLQTIGAIAIEAANSGATPERGGSANGH